MGEVPRALVRGAGKTASLRFEPLVHTPSVFRTSSERNIPFFLRIYRRLEQDKKYERVHWVQEHFVESLGSWTLSVLAGTTSRAR